jgi:hypothetical protein
MCLLPVRYPPRYERLYAFSGYAGRPTDLESDQFPGRDKFIALRNSDPECRKGVLRSMSKRFQSRSPISTDECQRDDTNDVARFTPMLRNEPVSELWQCERPFGELLCNLPGGKSRTAPAAGSRASPLQSPMGASKIIPKFIVPLLHPS